MFILVDRFPYLGEKVQRQIASGFQQPIGLHKAVRWQATADLVVMTLLVATLSSNWLLGDEGYPNMQVWHQAGSRCYTVQTIFSCEALASDSLRYHQMSRPLPH